MPVAPRSYGAQSRRGWFHRSGCPPTPGQAQACLQRDGRHRRKQKPPEPGGTL